MRCVAWIGTCPITWTRFPLFPFLTCFLRNVLLDTHSEAMERFKCKLQSEIGSDVTEYVKRVKQPGKYFLVPCSNWLSLCHATSLISLLCIFPIESLTYSQPPEIIDFLLKIEWKGERGPWEDRCSLIQVLFVCNFQASNTSNLWRRPSIPPPEVSECPGHSFWRQLLDLSRKNEVFLGRFGVP